MLLQKFISEYISNEYDPKNFWNDFLNYKKNAYKDNDIYWYEIFDCLELILKHANQYYSKDAPLNKNNNEFLYLRETIHWNLFFDKFGIDKHFIDSKNNNFINFAMYYFSNFNDRKKIISANRAYKLINVLSPLYSEEEICNIDSAGENILFNCMLTMDNYYLSHKNHFDDDLNIFNDDEEESGFSSRYLDKLLNDFPKLDLHIVCNKGKNILFKAILDKNIDMALHLIKNKKMDYTLLHTNYSYDKEKKSYLDLFTIMPYNEKTKELFMILIKDIDFFENNDFFKDTITAICKPSKNTAQEYLKTNMKWANFIINNLNKEFFIGTTNFNKKLLKSLTELKKIMTENNLNKELSEKIEKTLDFIYLDVAISEDKNINKIDKTKKNKI